MTSPTKDNDTVPSDIADELIIRLGALTIKAKEDVTKFKYPTAETLAEIQMLLGQLIWLSGSISMAEMLTQETENLIEVVN